MRSARLIVTLLMLAPAIWINSASAQVNTFIEDFSTTQYKNPFTTAVWDTVAGEVRLPRFAFTPSTSRPVG